MTLTMTKTLTKTKTKIKKDRGTKTRVLKRVKIYALFFKSSVYVAANVQSQLMCTLASYTRISNIIS